VNDAEDINAGDLAAEPVNILLGDVLDVLRELPDESIACCITSPPYWGLRDYGVPGMIGLEPTLQEHIDKIVEVFREVRRVLRSDGVLWLNYGDAYAGGGHSNPSSKSTLGGGKDRGAKGRECSTTPKQSGLAPKQRLMMPARVALALQADGWWIRSEIVWAKGLSFCSYSGSCMPSSVKDRPTDSHEMMYLLTKAPRYFYDGDAVREAAAQPGRKRSDTIGGTSWEGREQHSEGGVVDNHAGRNLRTVWTINPQAFSEAHFATFPEKLVTPCILAGTSEHGACSECGAPWRRVVSVEQVAKCRNVAPAKALQTDGAAKWTGATEMQTRRVVTTLGWQPTCSHPDAPVRPCLVLDPFSGSGTVGVVCVKTGRHYVGIELNEEYAEMSLRRIELAQYEHRIERDLRYDGRKWSVNGSPPMTQKDLRKYLKARGLTGVVVTKLLGRVKERGK